MAVTGSLVSNAPLYLAHGRRFRSRWPWRRRLTISTRHRLRHLYVVGSSGSGKTRFLRHLIAQDIAAGRGFTLVDPHGDLFREILSHIATGAFRPERGHGRTRSRRIDLRRLVILEPGEQRHGVPGINLLEVGPGQTAYQVVDSIIEVIKQIWSDSYGPRLEDVLRNSLLLLQEAGLTLLELLPLLSDAGFRAALVAKSCNPEVRLYFEQHLAGLAAGELKTWLESTRNKANAFLASPYIRPLLGQAHSTIDLREVLDEGKWLLVNVSRDRLKESRRLLGALLVALLHNAAVARETAPANSRLFHALYVDEFQEFFTPVYLSILEGSRKYGLALAMFHQNLTQEPFDRQPGIIDTVLANTHTQVCFNVSRKDAERLAGELFFPSGAEIKMQRHILGIPIEEPRFWSMSDERERYAAELMQQRPAQAYIRFKGLGDDQPYAVRVPPVADVTPDDTQIDSLRRYVAARHYVPLSVVEQEIKQRWASIRTRHSAPPPGRDYRK